MKFIHSIAAIMFFAVLLAVPTFAQTGAAAAAGSAKIALIDTGAFADEKAGIGKYIAAAKQLDTEFAPRRKELQDMQTQLQTLAKDLETLTKQASAPGTPVSTTALEQKRDQAETLQRNMQFKQQEAQAAYQKRQEAVIGPLFADIGKSIQDYGKQKGYILILDVSKMVQDGSLLMLDQTVDVTADFVKFYNARPAGTASTAAPK